MSPTSLAVQRRRFAVAAPVFAVVVLVFALLLTRVVAEPVRVSASGVGLLLAGVVAAVSCGQRAALTQGRRRRSWRLFMAAGVIAVLGNAWVTVTGSDPV